MRAGGLGSGAAEGTRAHGREGRGWGTRGQREQGSQVPARWKKKKRMPILVIIRFSSDLGRDDPGGVLWAEPPRRFGRSRRFRHGGSGCRPQDVAREQKGTLFKLMNQCKYSPGWSFRAEGRRGDEPEDAAKAGGVGRRADGGTSHPLRRREGKEV